MERIHVSVRSRPLSVEEANSSPWRISGNSIFIPNQPTKFQFDKIFSEDCSTREVYRARTKDIVAAAVSGFNGTVFAYGQTNSGKTYTMRGSETEQGIIPLAIQDLFDVICQDMDREFLLRVSYMEIYNEEINDLLSPEHRKLQIHENLERGIYVAGLREEIVASPAQVLDLMRFGESHRHIGETNMNLYSSRSHTIFRMIIESRDRSEDESNDGSCDAVRVSVLNLVDLAGSERATKTGAEGVRLKEGSHINKSLMTLGTVIKKLSEGAESQGGHVPYRDSKLTRILQPALGGNANTAIICNITLAQIHADETKSSLQFASRALRVTNCARVNETLTDAALLKRQKKEIEELRTKLQTTHSEHFEEEILNLRNTLLQTELERERIALELEEEKKTQAEWEKRVKEQAKKIENLSTMVLFSGRDETHERIKKDKRRDTWCPGNLARETLDNAYSTLQPKASDVKKTRYNCNVGPLLPFEELMHVTEPLNDYSCKQDDDDDDDRSNTLHKCSVPDPCTLLHVTRRKPPPKRKNSSMEETELIQLQTEYENLLLHSEMQRTMSEIHIDCLSSKLEETYSLHPTNCYEYSKDLIGDAGNNDTLRESNAILVIKRLQDQIKMLEMESSSSQKNLDSVVELATEQNLCARKKLEELYDELLKAKEEAKLANKKLSSGETKRNGDEVNIDFILHVSSQVQDMMSEVKKSEETMQSVCSLVDEVFSSCSRHLNLFQEFKTSLSQCSAQQNLIRSDSQKFSSYMKQRVTKLEDDKISLENQLDDLQEHTLELNLNVQNSQNSLNSLLEQHNLEKQHLVSNIETLEKELSSLSSWSKEKENFRKELDKMKTKLKETDSKLKIAIQEKTKLEGDKACADREIKQLHNQNTLLERDISKRESFVGNRRDSIMDKGTKVFDSKKSKGHAIALEQTLQENYKKMEILSFESETQIAYLEEELEFAYKEKGEMVSINESLVSEAVSLTERLQISNSELNKLHKEVSELGKCLEESNVKQQKLESSIKALVEEKEDLAMHLTDSLLEMEEERAIWSAKEKASIQAVEEKSRSYKEEIEALSKEMLQVKTQLDSCRGECNVLRERLNSPNTSAELKDRSYDNCSELGQKKNDIGEVCTGDQQSQHIPKSSSEMLSLEQDSSSEKVKFLRENRDTFPREREVVQSQIVELDISEDSNYIKHMKEQIFVMDNERDGLMSLNKQQLENRLLEVACLQKLGNDEHMKEQILVMDNERDGLMSLNKQLENRLLEVACLQKLGNDELLEKSALVDELTRKNSCLEITIREAESKSNIERTKLRMRLRGTQTKLDAFRVRYMEAVRESNLMNKKFEEAATKLKQRLSSKAIEVFNLKKLLADAKMQ